VLKNRKIIFLIFLLMLYCCDTKDCNPFDPDPFDPDDNGEIQFYNYQLEYRRPVDSIVDAYAADPSRAYLTLKHDDSSRAFHPELARQSDYLFTGRLIRIPGNSNIEMYVVDPKRWKETSGSGLVWGNPHAVGDIFILKCEQTGFEKELLKIVKNNKFSELPSNFDAYMAQFTVKEDGSIIDQ